MEDARDKNNNTYSLKPDICTAGFGCFGVFLK